MMIADYDLPVTDQRLKVAESLLDKVTEISCEADHDRKQRLVLALQSEVQVHVIALKTQLGKMDRRQEPRKK